MRLENSAVENTQSPAQSFSQTYTPVYVPEIKKPSKIKYFAFKRLMDVLLSLLAIIGLSPLMAGTALAIRLESKGEALYKQKRIGKDGKPFTMYKFRSMCQDAEEMLTYLQDKNERDGPVFKIKNDPRITKVGAFIRKTCIDELPQLFNILKGDMSIVGPRPPLPNEVEQYSPYHHRRLEVTPGLTCYWQISHREVTFDEWVDMDVKYIREQDFFVDLGIIIKTFLVVLKVSGDK